MKQPSSFEQIWDNLPSHLPDNPLPEGMEDRFWQRFSEELGPEEQQRQQRAARNLWWESLLQFRWIGLAAGSVAAALLVMVAIPQSEQGTRSVAVVQKANPEQKSAVASQTPDVTPKPNKSPQLYQDMQLYENMEVLEKMKLLEQLPTLTKGS